MTAHVAMCRLAMAMRDLLDDVPRLQRRYRSAVSRTHPDDAPGLVDAWIGFHRALTDARYEPETAALMCTDAAPEDPAGRDHVPEPVMEIAAELSTARIRLREQIMAAEAAEPATGAPDRATLLARWRLMHRGEHQLRRAVARAMSTLPDAEDGLLRGLAPLAAHYAAYLAAERTLAQQWAAVAAGGAAPDVARLDRWLAYTIDLRDVLDELTAGYGEPRPMPVPPWRSPAGAADDLRAVLGEFRAGHPDLIATCRRVLTALAGLNGRPAAGRRREDLLRAWERYADALAVLDAHLGRDQLDHAAELRDRLARRLAEAEAWLAGVDAVAGRQTA